MKHRMLCLAFGVVTAVAAGSPAEAQSRFEFTPFVGTLVPSKSLAVDTGGQATIENTTGTSYGAKLTFWAAPRIGLEASAAFASSQVQVAAINVVKVRSTTTLVDLRARYLLSNPLAPNSVFITGGVGLVDYRNALFDAGEETDQLKYKAKIGFVVGMGATFKVTSNLSLRADVENHIHSSEIEGNVDNFDNKTQHDLHISLGAVVPFGSR
jgi:opacity protein-like surface antigen